MLASVYGISRANETCEGEANSQAYTYIHAGMHNPIYIYIIPERPPSAVFVNGNPCRMQQMPPSLEQPWTIILYSDEITPGNALAADNKRKVWGVYRALLSISSHACVSNSF